MLVVLIILYILFGISLIYYEVKDLKEKKKLDVFDFFRLYYFAFYCITPIASLIVLIKGNPDNLKPFRYLETDSLLFKYITLVIQIFVFVLIEYASKKFFNKKIQLKKRKNYVIDDTKPYFYIGNLLLIIFSWLALILYTAAYGSVFGIFKYAPYIRDNIFFVENKLTFLQPFTMILLITSFNCICLLKQMKNKSKRYKIITIIISLISFFGEGCVLISIDSRTRIVMTIIISMFIILYDKINQKNIKKIWKFTPIIVILYFFVLNLNTITSFIRNLIMLL